MDPLLTLQVHQALRTALLAGEPIVRCSLDLGRTTVSASLGPDAWSADGRRFPYLDSCKERTIYYWDGGSFAPAMRFAGSLIKLVPTEWGAPTFEIDGIKMLPSAQVSPYADAERKVSLIQPRGKIVLDTCGGLGYFAAWCLEGGAARVWSFEKNPDVVWLRTLNPWSPAPSERLQLAADDIVFRISTLAADSMDAVLHDPPRFGVAGELYSQAFYGELARVLKRRGTMFHYTGTPNKLTSGRDVPNEVARRLRHAGFTTELAMDGVLARKL